MMKTLKFIAVPFIVLAIIITLFSKRPADIAEIWFIVGVLLVVVSILLFFMHRKK
jgi:hypothetical protein